jgi:threonine/homoserine/homoserine lactone efflux protein
MEITFFLRGLAIGFSIAVPVGPVNLLCMRRTLAEGRLSGLVSGLGAATADAIYGAIAAFGLTFISDFLVSQQVWFRVIGGLFICFLGVRAWLAKPVEQAASATGKSLLGDYASTFFLTAANPATIIAFAVIFAGLGMAPASGNYLTAAVLVLGVFLGSMMWWLILCSVVGRFRKGFDPGRFKWINRIAGVVLVAFGMAALLSAL